ncbi:hypothetical protein BGY98DRAFT_226982 [Russula aff. rugulosa BPL654]|nr:hypothetical protein BGY98DRAFT_226982 [Russula aff. rugulosa BPL654]
MSNPDSHTTPQTKQTSKGGLFSWARPRGRTKSKASLPDPSLSSAPVLTLPPDDSFNIKAFRHVTSPSPGTPPSGSSSDRDPLPRPRPREDSDESQRISVAAFREARRSTANASPVPSLPGDRESFPSSQVGNHRRSIFATPPSALKGGSQARSLLPSRPPTRSPPARTSTAPLSFATSMTTSSDYSEEGESESEEEATLRPSRKRTITSRSAQSEAGFRSSPVLAYGVTRSDIGHGSSSAVSTRPSPSPRNKANNAPKPEGSGVASRSSSVYSHKRASLSTPTFRPDTAMKRGAAAPRYSVTALKPAHVPPRSRSRASTSSESSSESGSSEDAPLASLVQPQRPGSAMSRGSGPRRPTKPLVDIGQLVGENSVIPPCASEPPKPSLISEADSPTVRNRKTSLGLVGERLSALASGIGGLQPSRSKSPDSTLDSRDEAFTPPEMPEKLPSSQSPILSSPTSNTNPSSPILKPKTNKSPSASHAKSFSTPKIDTQSLKPDTVVSPPPSSSTSSDAPIPHITPTPIRQRQDPPAFAVTSRPISNASSPSIATFTAFDKTIADMYCEPELLDSLPVVADEPKEVKQQQRRQPQEDSQTTVRVVRSAAPKYSREEPLPVPRLHARSRPPAVGVTVSNIHLTPPSASNPRSALRQASGSGVVMPPRKPFALRDSSPVSSAGDSSSSRMPITPRDGSELGTGPTGRPAVGHRKRASVTFLDEVQGEKERREGERRPSMGKRPGHGRGPSAIVSSSSEDEDTARDRERDAEEKRKTRRRTEAKAAIELGNVINGPGPIDDDDDDDDDDEPPMNVPPRMSMAMGMGMNAGNNIPFPSGGTLGLGQWGASGPTAFGSQLSNLSMQNLFNAGAGPGHAGGMDTAAGMNMGMGMVDPRVFAVHQQAMMIAKQTYQLAVAQQAMRDRDEWMDWRTVKCQHTEHAQHGHGHEHEHGRWRRRHGRIPWRRRIVRYVWCRRYVA